MLYFRKIWMAILLVAVGIRAFCKYVVLDAVDYVDKFGGGSHHINSVAWKKESIVSVVHVVMSDMTKVIFWTIGTVVIVMVLDICIGQFSRDIKTIQITGKLIRDVPEDNLQLVALEENSANKWIRRGRILKWKNKLIFVIPCLGNSSVVSVIQKRCDNYLLGWLNTNFKRISWSPIESKTYGMLTLVFVREK